MKFNTLQEAISAALVPPAAPAQLVDKVFAQTTRRPAWFVRWRKVLAGSMAALLMGAGVYAIHHRTDGLNRTELVAYMSAQTSDDYAAFLSDLELLEQEF